MRRLCVVMILITGLFSFGISEAVETELVIRAKSKDAKFVGTKMGGAVVVIKDSETGKVLSRGLTAGGTGDTARIMMQPRSRFGTIAEGAALFETSIDIEEPMLITIDVEAPYMYKDNMIKSSIQMWAIPGKHITGEGIIIEIPGFSVDARTKKVVDLKDGKAGIPVQARIVMI